MDPMGYLFRQVQDGENFANIVLNNTNVCCFSCCGPKRETVAKNIFGGSMNINPSLPKMPPVLVGKLDEATWKTVLRAMGKTGSIAPDVFLNICSRLTCTCCCVMPCAVAWAAADHEVKVTAFMAEFETNEALKKAGVSIKRCTADLIDAQGSRLGEIVYIRFEVAPQGVPSTASPAAQDMA